MHDPHRRSFDFVTTTAARDCLAGGGEMGARMRALDWSKTPLGPVESWPQSLRTSVSIVLSSRFPLVVWWGPELVFLYNDAYAPILGKKHPDAFGRKGQKIWPEIWHIIGPMLARVMERGEASWSEDQMLPIERDGFVEECYFTFSYSAIRDERGIAGVFTAVTETTERILLERRLRTLRALAERASEAKSAERACEGAAAILAENPADVPFAILYLVSEDGRRAHLTGTAGIGAEVATSPVVELPPGAAIEDTWGITETLSGSTHVVTDLRRRLGPLRSGPWPDTVKRAIVVPIGRSAAGAPQAFLVAGVSPRLALDDSYRGFFELVGEHVATAIANANAYETERKRAEALAELDRVKTTFFSNVSHEFRTPLTLMLGPLEELLSESPGPLSEGQRQRAELMHRNAQRLLKLVNTMLDFARIEAGRVDAIFEPVDLALLTTELAGTFRSAVERAGLELRVQCPPLGEPVYVDRDMWEKIVLNLISNAFKFTFEGHIDVTLGEKDGRVELCVADTGTGIPQSELPNVLNRFYRAKSVRGRTHEGTGIGLALVQELVRLHGGELTVESELGKGSTFRATVRTGTEHLQKDRIARTHSLGSTAIEPAAFVEEVFRWLPEAARAGAMDHESTGRTGRVLVADDNSDMRDYLRRLLGERWSVQAVADGREALKAIQQNPPDLVLTDVMMPNGGGFELLRAVKSDPRTASIPVIMVSARAGEEARVEGLGAGADDYLVKPFSARELMARVSSQLAIAKARQTIERQRAEFYELFMQAPAPICVLRGSNLSFEMANPSFLKLAGRSAVVGQPLLEVMPDLAAQGVDTVLRQVIDTARPNVRNEVLVRHDGDGTGDVRDTYWTFVCAPLRDSDGNVNHVMVFANEITDQVHARNDLEAARQQAEAANRAKDEFLAMLGHELRNPLAPITTALELMKVRAGDMLVNERTVIERQVLHLVRLVDDLLDVSRIARGKVQLRRRRVELAEIVSKGIEMASPLFEERNHRLTVEVPSGVVVYADEVRLAQVIANLLTNAAKYTDPGGDVAIRVSREKGEAVLSVRDNGIGIAPELLPRVFDLFVQGKRADFGQSGLGLGLTLVRSLVTLHGGSVAAHSNGPGRGSEFVVRLPLSGSSDAIPRVEVRPDRTAEPAKARRRVLVVDDNRDAAEVLAEALRVYGHEARLAFDGPGALDVAASFHPDVALLDIGLPVMDGYELARRLRELPEGRKIRLIAVTGYGQESDRRRSREAGFDRHLVKPIDVTSLETLIEQLFRGSDMPPSSVGPGR